MPSTNSRVAAFDMDGTVIDSMPMLTELGIQTIMTNYGRSRQQARTAYDRTVGIPFRDQLEQLFPEAIQNDLAAASYRATHLAVAPLFPVAKGFAQFMRWSMANRWHTVLISSTDARIIEKMPQIRDLAFTVVRGYRGGAHKASQLRAACIALGVAYDQQNTVYFGDAHADRAYAESLGIRFQYATVHSVANEAHLVCKEMQHGSLARVS